MRATTPVVHIIDHLGLGGVQTLLRAVLPELPAHGYAPAVISLRGPTPLAGSLSRAGVPVRSLGLPRWSPRQLLALVAELRRLQPAIVHTHLTVGNTLGRLAAILAGAPAIVLEEQISPSQAIYGSPPLVTLAARLIEPPLAARTARFLGPSAVVLAASAATRGWPAARCRVRHNAVDCRRFAPTPDRAAARATLGLPERPTLATFGRFVPQKRIGDAVAVLRCITGAGLDAQLLIAGGGPEEGTIRAAVAAAGLTERVWLLGHRHDTERLLAASELYLSPSGGEVLSLAILEAMAAELPVVATTAGGTPELVEDGVSGYLRPIGDVTGLAAVAAGLLNDPATRTRMGRAGRVRALARFDVPIIAAEMAMIYSELVAAPQPTVGPSHHPAPRESL